MKLDVEVEARNTKVGRPTKNPEERSHRGISGFTEHPQAVILGESPLRQWRILLMQVLTASNFRKQFIDFVRHFSLKCLLRDAQLLLDKSVRVGGRSRLSQGFVSLKR
jgi:hypothetical protein